MTKAAFARAVGRSKSTISEHLQGPLKEALMRSGRIDAASPAARAYATACGVDKLPVPAPPVAPPEQFDVPENVDDLLDLTYRQITDRYGSQQGFADFVAVRKVIADTRRLELANEETDGTTISRELVRQHVFGYIDNKNRTLLTDMPKTIARRVFGLCRASETIERAEAEVRDLISSVLRDLKTKAARALRADPEAKTAPK
ncbi:MAG TPA: hypothetical protein VH062_10230 [Polyangiaceae bacterium]|jgi:hypothetical protein|nr:hypothetical protein [Polyangiaceae bacterium]